MYLELFASPEYVYHQESPLGRDIYGIGKALGVAGIGALVDGKVTAVADVAERKWKIVASGPVRSIVDLEYKGWKVGDRTVDLTSRIDVYKRQLDMSGSGVLLRFDGAVQLAPGDEVTCDFKLSSDADNSLPHWGIGTVVRVDGRSVAIELKAGGLCELEPKAEVPTVRESVPRA